MAKKNGCNGFSLVEVLVASALLGIGVVAINAYMDYFENVRAIERGKAQSLMEAIDEMEKVVKNPPDCKNTDKLIPVAVGKNNLRLWRVVRCR